MLSKTLLITGVCTNGIGYETCKRILEVQKVARVPTRWHLILAQRDDKSQTAIEARKNLERLAQSVQGSVKAYKCDLACFESVRQFVEQVGVDVPRIDVLVLNAGKVINARKDTVDGMEMIYQVNHLGHFLLLSMLKDRIGDKVIFVGSSLHKKADSSRTLQSLKTGTTNETGMKQYSQSKLLTAYCLHKWEQEFKDQNVKVVLVSPGFIPSSALARDNSRLAQLAMSWIIHYLPFARTLQQGGHTLAALAIGAEWSACNGCYLNADLKPERMHDDVYDEEHAQQVWNWSSSMISGHV